MGQEKQYPTSAALDEVVQQMYRKGITYAEAVREFHRQFILTVLRDLNWNSSKAATVLRMHRNTLRRMLRDLNLDIHGLRESERRPARRENFRIRKKLAS